MPRAEPAKKSGGPRYFEFSEGSSNKFWEVSIKGTSVRTRYGKIVKGICKKVVTEEQQKPYDWGEGELHYYCDITE